ncbi:hypothetical protein RFI_36821, partial [Reticulomyxa filosa]
MLLIEEGEKEKKTAIFSISGCYNKDWISLTNEPQKLNTWTCLLCKQIANNAVELHCDEHENFEQIFLIGEECLRQYLQQSNRKCPVGQHDHCEFFKSKTARQSVSELLVMCPRQYKSNEDLQLSERTKTREDEKSICRFKGEIKEVQHHLETSCQLLASRQNNSLDIQNRAISKN